jgi:hypothetical protein
MSETGEKTTSRSKGISKTPRSLEISERGVSTGQDLVNLMSSLMSDLIASRIQPTIANAVCNAAGKMLKVVELQQKFGKDNQDLSGFMLAEKGESVVQ